MPIPVSRRKKIADGITHQTNVFSLTCARMPVMQHIPQENHKNSESSNPKYHKPYVPCPPPVIIRPK